jgi:Nif-specific regulatory protein
MGEVFLARDMATGAECALKRLVPRAGARFSDVRREFEILTRLRHPAVVSVIELGFAPDGTPFYTMEYVPGLPADRAIPPGDWPALFFVAAGVAHALEALHAVGVVHGDLKPSNLLVVPGPRPGALPASVRLLDFGLAALGDEVQGHRGTPGYAAPEVVRGEAPKPAADLYGLGSTLYTLIAGRPAFEGDSTATALGQQQAGPPSALPLEEAGAPAPLVQLVLSLMAPEPGERPRDARELRRELETLSPAAARPLVQRLQTAVTVGRERELATLEQRLARPSRRQRVVLVCGESGIGKSVLLRELAARVTLTGRSVIHLACTSLQDPGAGVLALARWLAAEARAEPASDARLPESARTLLSGGRDGPSEADLDPLVNAAVSWQQAVHKRSGVPVVLLDDTDLLDPLSRAFLRRLVLYPAAPPTVWVWTTCSRTTALSEDDRVLLDAGVAESLELNALSRDDIARLAAARLHEPSPEHLTEFLWSRALGHPGLTVELMLRAAALDALREDETGLIADPEALETVRVPESFEATLAARLLDLPPAARSAAAALAALQAPAEAERVRAVEPAAGEPALAALLQAGLATRDAAGRIALVARALGERVLVSVGDEVRRALHLAVLSQPGLSHAERFHHFCGAGDPANALVAAAAAFDARPDASLAAAAAALAESSAVEQAAGWHERAGQELFTGGRYQSAISHLERAIELDAGRASRLRRMFMLSTAYLRAGMPAEVDRVISQALAEDPPVGLRSRLLGNEAARLQVVGQPEAARAAAREALAMAEAAGDDEAAGMAAQSLVYSLLDLGRHDDAEAAASRATEAFRRAGHVLGLIRSMGARAAVARARQRLPDAERLYREALEMARSRGIRLAIEELLNGLGMVLTESGQWDRMREMYAEAARLALEDHRPRGAAVAIANLAQADGLAGRARLALRQSRAAIRLTRAHAPWLEASAWRSRAQACRIAGRIRRAERAARRALEQAMQRGIGYEVDWCRIEYGRALQARGSGAEAAAVWDRALETAQAEGSVGRAVLLSLSGRAALRRGDHSVAATRLSVAEEWLKGRVAPYASALAGQLRAELALSQGRLAEGLIQAEKTLADLLALPAPWDRAMAALDLGRLALGGDARSDAPVGEWLEQAAGTFERTGDHRNRERALALALRWLRRRGPVGSVGTRDRSLIESVSQLLNSLSDLKELTQRAMQMVVEQLDAERGVLLLDDAESGKLAPITEHGAVDSRTRHDAVGYSRRVVQRVAESGGSLLIGDAPSDPRGRSESMVDLHLRSIVCVPMFLGGKVIGAVYLDDSRRAQAFSEADRGLLEGFAHLMAVAIDKSRGHEEVQRANELLVGENLSLRQEATVRFQPHRLIGVSLEMQRVLAMVERAALTNSTVLLTGENGTGKELIARVLHHSGKRRLHPFLVVNCGAIPETLLESELFGILPNVATGVRGRDGRFKQADGGTLFLDEIGDMPLKQQVALLSAISNREITPVGGGKPIPVDVRIMAATNRDLRRLIQEGAFREDLYYRLNVIPLEVPALRERKADIPLLTQHFVAHFARLQERDVPELSAEFLAALMQSDWPGNVRELQNYIERVMAMNLGSVLHPVPLPRDLEDRAGILRLGRGRRLTDLVEDLERRLVEEALVHAQGNQSLAARQLGVPEQAIRYRIRKYGLRSIRQNRRTSEKWR